MNNSFTIRKAEKKDCPAMLQLVHELALYEKAPQEVTITMSHFEKSGFGENPIWWAFVAEDKNAGIVGMALYYIRFSTWKGKRVYLEDIIVTEPFRGKGIGAMLFESVKKEAEKGDFSGMNWQVLDWNKPAIDFYKKYQTKFDGEWLNGIIDFK